MNQPYSTEFFGNHRSNSARSAQHTVPVVLDLVRPKTVLDLGCGIGTWVASYLNAEVDAYGVDGDYVEQDQLMIPRDRFAARDLTVPFELPSSWPERFDLVTSLEVAEHLPPDAADAFVDTVIRFSRVVLFSAAIPHQGGTHHVNEQWQTYWAQRFGERGFRVVDAVRPQIWDHPEVSYIYAQNALLYVHQSCWDEYPGLHPYERDPDSAMLSVVHPKKWLKTADPNRQSLRKVVGMVPNALKNSVSRR